MKLIRYQTPVTGWSSFDRLSPLRNLLDSAFVLASANSHQPGTRAWTPALDVYEDDKAITVRVEASGIKKDDFDISLHEDTLTVSGERKEDKPSTEGESFRSERFFGAFSRSIQLPAEVNAESVTAEYTDGVLSIVLPKSEEAKPKKIAVTVN